MEKKSAIGLKGYFTRTLLIFFIGIVAIWILSLLMLLICMQAGIIVPANTGEREARAEIVRQSESAAFTGDLSPDFYDYIYFDAAGNVLESSLTGDALSRELSRYPAANVSYGTAVYVFYEDGSRCLFSWQYVASYTSPTLRRLLPNAESLMLIVAAAASIIFFLLFVRGMGRHLGSKLSLVEDASEQIAKQNLDASIAISAGIKEFDNALQSMDDMRSTLKDALINQWESEQQRKQEIAALAHDIKTPLTIIGGNAGLLLEDSLSTEQTALVESICRAGTRAQQYVSALQQVANMDVADEEMEPLSIAAILSELSTVLSPLSQERTVEVEYIYGENLNDIRASLAMLTRALINIAENAIQHTEPGGKVTITVLQNETDTSFIVQDGGTGFSMSALQHAKEMFWQQDKSRTSSKNYGIGLSIADKVAKKHSGELILENTPQGGRVILSIKNNVSL